MNRQLKSYVSWRPDPDAMDADAFALNWSSFRAFCFPPFSLISRVLQTLEPCQAKCVIVVPFWTTQVWFSKLINCWRFSSSTTISSTSSQSFSVWIAASSSAKDETDRMFLVREALENKHSQRLCRRHHVRMEGGNKEMLSPLHEELD